MAVTRILRTAAVTLSHVFEPGEIPTAATGSVTVTLTRLDGTVVSTGNATGPDGNQVYTYPYAGSADLDELIVTWSATVAGDAVTLDQDRVQIVGAHMFSVAEARGFDPLIGNKTKYPLDLIESTRIEVEDEAMRICDQSFTPRFARDVLDGTGAPYLALRHPLVTKIRSVKVARTFGDPLVAFDVDQLSRVPTPVRDGVLRLDSGFIWPTTAWWFGGVWPFGRSNVIVEYEHGWDRPSSDVARAGKLRLKSLLLETQAAVPDRAERVAQTPVGVTLQAIPDAERTGVPAVDAVYLRVPDPRPGFG